MTSFKRRKGDEELQETATSVPLSVYFNGSMFCLPLRVPRVPTESARKPTEEDNQPVDGEEKQV